MANGSGTAYPLVGAPPWQPGSSGVAPVLGAGPASLVGPSYGPGLGLFPGFYPAEDAYAPGDSMGVRPVSPDSFPFGVGVGNAPTMDRRAVPRSPLGIPLVGLVGLIVIMALLEGWRPKV